MTTQTSQAVEAAVQQPEALRLAAWLNEGAWHQMKLGDVEAAGRELRRLHNETVALRAALTSQQEVAAPAGPTPEMIAALKEAFKEGSIWEDRITAGLRAALAASLVPVASEPVAWRWRLRDRLTDKWGDWRHAERQPNGPVDEWFEVEPLYANPTPEQGRAGGVGAVAGSVTGLDGVSRPNPAAGAPKPPFHNPVA